MVKLEKNKTSAVILSAITVLTFSVTDFALNILIPWIIQKESALVQENTENLMAAFLFVALMLLFLVAIGAFWLYRFFGDRYYGPRGAAFWALFGTLFAIFLIVPEWGIQDQIRWIRIPLQLAGLFGAFFLARWLARIPRNKTP